MALFDKKGLSESQRKELALIEKAQRESQKRLESALPEFKKEYTSLVNYHKIRHNAVIGFVEGTPDWVRRMVLGVAKPVMQLIECAEEIEVMNNKAIQIEIAEHHKAVDPEGN